jgi:hypothetical protein
MAGFLALGEDHDDKQRHEKDSFHHNQFDYYD